MKRTQQRRRTMRGGKWPWDYFRRKTVAKISASTPRSSSSPHSPSRSMFKTLKQAFSSTKEYFKTLKHASFGKSLPPEQKQILKEKGIEAPPPPLPQTISQAGKLELLDKIQQYVDMKHQAEDWLRSKGYTFNSQLDHARFDTDKKYNTVKPVVENVQTIVTILDTLYELKVNKH